MIDIDQLPYLLELLDDDSPEVRQLIAQELTALGPRLKEEVVKVPFAKWQSKLDLLNKIWQNQQRSFLRENWKQVFVIENDTQRLEKAMSLLSDFQTGLTGGPTLSTLLDQLAQDFLRTHQQPNVLKLARFLFHEKKLRGSTKEYYHPQNSSLIDVILRKEGLPISLACVYMLVGIRLGIVIEGCNFPGHFLARISQGESVLLVDCFNQGQLIREEDLMKANVNMNPNHLREILRETAPVNAVIKRVLANLIRAYHWQQQSSNQELMIDLFKDMDDLESLATLTVADIERNEYKARFLPGQMVRHKRYGYRGIVVDHDQTCQASDTWYFSNQTQPQRNQPWYHVLVHDSDQVTYAAQSSLEGFETEEKFQHPLLEQFFIQTLDGRHIRNNNPWPK